MGLDVSLQSLLLRPDFFGNSELWRLRQVNEGVLMDIYDGKFWNDFQCYDRQPFLSQPGNFAWTSSNHSSMCNILWVQFT